MSQHVPVSLSRLAHVSLTTPSIDRMVEHYTQVLGLTDLQHSGDTVQLSCGDGSTALELTPGSASALDHVAFEVRGRDLDGAASSLRGHGLTVSDWKGADEPGTEAFFTADPEGSPLKLLMRDYSELRVPGPVVNAAGIRPHKIGHVARRVGDAKAIRSFFEGRLGFRYSDSVGDSFVFLRCNADHHSLNLLEAGTPGQMHHMAFQLHDWNHLRRACDELAARGIPLAWGPGRHGPGHQLFCYYKDPDGNIVELFCDLDSMSDESSGVFDWRPWHNGVQRPRAWDPAEVTNANTWGIPGPDGFMS